MPCTTILVGKKASYDGSTIISRNDDSPSGSFHVKKMVVVDPAHQPRKYTSKIGHLTIELPDDPLSYTATPNVDPSEGIWAASGINSANVCMSATETITTNGRVLGADPMVEYVPAKGGKKAVPGGIGEEDLVVITLPYIRSAREGVKRLGALLEKYGTYESNGIAFSDKDEIWWLESIGGHHWIARRVADDEVVIMPNQFGLDRFDFEDAFGAQRDNMCSADLKEFIEQNHLDLNVDGQFNPRLAFGSHSDSDHVYNTPRAWYMLSYLNRKLFEEGHYQPEDDDIPWSFKPDRKLTIDDVKYIQSSHYQGTEYDPYGRFNDSAAKGKYRPIGISRTGFCHISQIRGYAPEETAAIEWLLFSSNVFNTPIPVFTRTDVIPDYLSKTKLTPSTDSFYWTNRIIAALSDPHFTTAMIHVERYQDKCMAESYRHINEYDAKVASAAPAERAALVVEANQAITDFVQEQTTDLLSKVLYNASMLMKNGYAKSDN